MSENARVNIRVVYYPDESTDTPRTVAELEIPADIGVGRTAVHIDSVSFDAELPFDHKKILAGARDLQSVPGLGKKVLAYYNKGRQMMIDGKYAEYYTMRFMTAGVVSEMNYWNREALRKLYLAPDYLFRF